MRPSWCRRGWPPGMSAAWRIPGILQPGFPPGRGPARAVLDLSLIHIYIESGATYTGITGTGGSYTFTKLKPGAYEIRELSAPEGWQRDPQTYTTTVVAGDCVT